MGRSTFDALLKLTEQFLKKQDTRMRRSIPAEDHLVATLRFLATGRSYEDLKCSSAISPQALGYIIPETCWTLFEVLKSDILKFPNTKEEWKQIAEGFKSRWQIVEALMTKSTSVFALLQQKAGCCLYKYTV